MQKKGTAAWYYAVGIGILVLVGTMVVRIPLPSKGYFNFGDVLVIFGARLLGRKLGGLAGGIGSALADILSGYAIYAPLTFIAKGLEGYIAGAVLRYEEDEKRPRFAGWYWAAAGSVVMVLGYFLGECIMPQVGFAYALSGLIPNFTQAALGCIGGLLLFELADAVGIGENL